MPTKLKITQVEPFFVCVDRRNDKTIINAHTSGGTGIQTSVVASDLIKMEPLFTI